MYVLSALLSSAALTGRTLRTPQRAARLTPPRCDLAGEVGALQDRVEMLQALVTKQEQIIGTLLHEQYGQGEKKRDPSSAPGGPSAASDDSPGDAPAGPRWHRPSDDTGDAISTLFEWIDDNGDGVLTREEYLTHFDRIDGDGDGFVTKDEFREGLWILTSSTATAAAARGEIEAAVAAERVRAIKEASRLLTEAELLDAKAGGGLPSWRSQWGGPRGGGYRRDGALPAGFDEALAQALVDERAAAKRSRNFVLADELQARLKAMDLRLDDRLRTWSANSGGSKPDLRRTRGQAQRIRNARPRATPPTAAI